jgi:hypothetical protein
MRDAFSYFSILPVGSRGAPRANALAWLPLVGAVTGGIAGGVAQLAAIVFGHPIAVALAFGLSIGLTGALHVDGFLDASDALGASVSPQRRREILKDPRHGTFAVANFAVAAALWLAALATLAPGKLALGTAAGAAAARWCIVWLAFLEPYGEAGAPPVAGTLAGALRARPPCSRSRSRSGRGPSSRRSRVWWCCSARPRRGGGWAGCSAATSTVRGSSSRRSSCCSPWVHSAGSAEPSKGKPRDAGKSGP